jgi:maleylpyruvate isomerase
MTGPYDPPYVVGVTNAATELERRLAWVRDGTARFEAGLARLDDKALNDPSLLPGWSRRHLLAHVAANADALCRLAYWARTGEERRMYASPGQRNAEIEVGAGCPAKELRDWVADSAAQLAEDLGRLPEPAWQAQVITAQGRTVPASEIPWLRAREAYVHTVDLDAGLSFEDLPADFLTELLGDVAARRSAQGTGPALTLTASDTGGVWEVTGDSGVYAVEAPLPVLTAWITGRPTMGPQGTDSAIPDLPPWL